MLEAESQRLNVGDFVILFQLDCRALGGDVYYFTENCYSTGPVHWRNIDGTAWVAYTPIDIQATGFSVSGQGSLPRPKLGVANARLNLGEAIKSWDDLLGSVVYRYRTLAKHMQEGSSPNRDIYWPPDIFEVERKTSQDKFAIEWELKAMMDNEGIKLPRRQILRDACTHIYRVWNGTTFKYGKATCPYTREWNTPAKNITSASRALLCVLGVPAHGLKTDDYVYINSTVGGMTQIRDKCFQITVLTPDSYYLRGCDSSTYSAYTSGGTAGQITVFDNMGMPVLDAGKNPDPSKDSCGKRLSDCRKRFTGTEVLPTRAFPGVARVRV